MIRDPHLGTGISNSAVVDWAQLSASQMARDDPDAVVVFIGANEGYGIPGPDGKDVECCGPDYAAAYANRVRQVMDTFRARRRDQGLLAHRDDPPRRRRGPG